MVAHGNNVIDIKAFQIACTVCSMRQLCLPIGLSHEELGDLDEIIHHRPPLRRGDRLFKQGQPLSVLFAVRSGSVKTTVDTEDGLEKVISFGLPGELIGMEAICEGVHRSNAIALETTSVCEIPFDRLDEVAGRIPSLRRQLLRLMSREIADDQRQLQLLGGSGADQRLAAFLVALSRRFEQRGFSPREFNLSMSRQDVAAYLGMAVETVSRLLSRFSDEGAIAVDRKHITLLDIGRLEALANGEK
jgi:CRP/FNR family transcriptional regulator